MTWKIKGFDNIKELNFIRSKCQAISFDGLNESLQGPNDPAFELERFDPVTFAAWVKFRSPRVTLNPIVIKYETVPSLGRGYVWGAHWNGSTFVARYNLAHAGSNSFNQFSVEQIPFNQWVHFATTYNGSGSATGVQHYLNGVPLTANITNDNLTNTIITPGIIEVGSLTTSFTRWSDMELNRVRMWNTELSFAEVLQDYSNQLVPQSGNLILNLVVGNDTIYTSPTWTVLDKSPTGANFTSSNMDATNKLIIPDPICI